MATALITAFLAVKMKDSRTSTALYSVSSDVDGARIAKDMSVRSNKAIVRMLETAREPLATDPQLVASTLQAAMFGVSRTLLESSSPEKRLEPARAELIRMACAYLESRSITHQLTA
jgi:hypothetical protein